MSYWATWEKSERAGKEWDVTGLYVCAPMITFSPGALYFNRPDVLRPGLLGPCQIVSLVF